MKHSLLLAATLAVSLLRPIQAQTDNAPNGWKTQLRDGGATTFTPPDLATGEVYSVTLYDAVALDGKSLEAYLRAFAGPVGTKPGQLSAPLVMQAWGNAASAVGFYVGPNGSKLGALFLGATQGSVTQVGGAHIAVSRTFYSRTELLSRYGKENLALNKILTSRVATVATTAHAPAISKAAGPLPAANLGGAKVFVKYYWRNYPTLSLEIGHLLLFPSGAAFDDVPSQPLGSWSETALQKALHPNRVGKWKMAGEKLILSFPRASDTRTLLKNPRGWADPSGVLMDDSPNADIYFPVVAAPRAQLVGAWKNESLGGAGTFGGAAPLVAGGSTGDLVLGADGTFGGGKSSFFSSTTSNQGEAFKSGADVFTSGKTRSQSSGQWRLDGPLLTLGKDGARTVQLAFLLPYWSKNPANTDLMIGNQRWERPKK